MKNKWKFYIQKTKSSIKHLGVVSVIISLSVMFSALSIMSLISLSDSLQEELTGNPKSQIGAEVRFYFEKDGLEYIKENLDILKSKDIVSQYAYLGNIDQQYIIYSNENFSQEYISIVSYEDANYPLEGVMNLVSGNEDMSILFEKENGIVISQLLAERQGIQVGDSLTLVSQDLFTTETFEVVDLIDRDYQGSIYSAFVNSKKVLEFENITGYTFYIDGEEESIISSLQSLDNPPMSITSLSEVIENSVESDRSFLLFIRGLSILGLFIGSFGIASAVKVIINKRKRELGILKSIGFVEKDISIMLLMEVAFISLIGGILGVVLGYVFFYYLIEILSSGDFISIVLNRDFNIIAASIAFGTSVMSSVLFAFLSIKQTSQLKPIYALKDLDYVQTKKEKGKNIVRFLTIGVIFVGISIFLANSVIYGIGAVVLAAVSILIFSLIFRLIFKFLFKIKLRTHNELELAWKSLGMNYKKIVVSMIAIFIGMTAVNLINSLVYSTKAVYSDRHEEVTADINIVIDKANPDGEIEEIIDNSEYIEESFYISKAKSGSNYDIVVGVDIEEFAEFYNLTEGEQSEGSILLPSYKKAWESYNEDGSFVSTEGYEIGDLYTLNIDDNEYELPVSGFYDVNYESSVTTIANLHSTQAILLEKDFSKYYESKYIGEYWISTKKENIELVTNDFSEIDNTFITTTKQYEDMINGVMDMMIQFSTSVASLALLAGIILIITVTVLDVISRKRDFAIYKVVGFKQREISKMVLMEYGIITSLTAISASIFVYIITIVLTNYGDQLLGIDEEIFFDLKGSVIWNLVLIAFVLSLVHLVSKKTLSVKPKEVLRYE